MITKYNRQIFLDTETTGLDADKGERVIELGCVEVVDRQITNRYLHLYFNPEGRESSEEALRIHGIQNEFLQSQPRFATEVQRILQFLSHADIIIHNAAFDVGFLNMELKRANCATLEHYPVNIIDSLAYANEEYVGQRNSLDALCSRLGVDNSSRTFHGALLDANLLAQVWLKMTGGQTAFDYSLGEPSEQRQTVISQQRHLKVVRASEQELATHQDYIERIQANPQWWES